MTTNIASLCINMCIQKLCGPWITDQPSSTLSEWWRTWPHHVPVLSGGRLWHVDLFNSFWSILPNFNFFPQPAPSPRFPRGIISNVKYLNYVHQVCAENSAVGGMDECSMAVVIQTDSYWALTAPSMTRMTSLTYILLVNFVTNLVFAFLLNSNWHKEIKYIGCLTAWFGFWDFHMVCTTIAHPQTNYCISQFVHWNQEKSDI